MVRNTNKFKVGGLVYISCCNEKENRGIIIKKMILGKIKAVKYKIKFKDDNKLYTIHNCYLKHISKKDYNKPLSKWKKRF